MQSLLEKELATYQRELPALIKDEGRFVVIKGDDVIDVFDSYADAMKFAYARFGLEPFFVKKISAIEQAHFFTRNIFSNA